MNDCRFKGGGRGWRCSGKFGFAVADGVDRVIATLRVGGVGMSLRWWDWVESNAATSGGLLLALLVQGVYEEGELSNDFVSCYIVLYCILSYCIVLSCVVWYFCIILYYRISVLLYYCVI